MKLSDAIDIVDRLKRNQFSLEDKIRWIADLDEQILEEVIKPREGAEEYASWERYGTTAEELNRELIVPNVYAEIYTYKLAMEIDYANGELNKYANDQILYNKLMSAYQNWYNHYHMVKPKRITGYW
jgi:hypothetical protein